ncbi:TetR/AcrR family transcriptional regulator [Pseudodesulfovibrio thermohalotolerans]|uniref:TetR/AcrR family transcriptional regulator n=1 Tax=Pseudodesulfovibrio thermohalotolerans TaxID=2880651 RepID=UPI00244216D7|nr:TetR/AcrR family transcriptional regulator [Pseudodesulfovibrio thermohalotolerans]WFS62948.1 TetR/AcrR family transcriptional regulator [Pseudodesulfovibrio thermohalotolerans]
MRKYKEDSGQAARLRTHRRGAPRGPRKAKQRRKVLLDSAGKLFVEKGYESTTMDEIASGAGFAKGTLYHYFSNKAELLLSLREEFDKEVARRIQSHVEKQPADDWRGRIKAWVIGAVEAYFTMSELHDLVVYGSGMPFRNTMAHSEVTRHLARLIADGAQAGAWDVEDSRWIAFMMFYSFRGGCDEAMVGAQPAEDIPGRLYLLFLRMLGVRERSIRTKEWPSGRK